MNASNAVRAEILTQAVPYIKEYTGKYVVAKYGGNAMTDPALKKSVMQDILLLSLVGVKVILVHGGGPEISAMLKRLSIESHFEKGLRVTDDATMEVVQMVLAGKVNKSLAANLTALAARQSVYAVSTEASSKSTRRMRNWGRSEKLTASTRKYWMTCWTAVSFLSSLPSASIMPGILTTSMPTRQPPKLLLPSMRNPWWS